MNEAKEAKARDELAKWLGDMTMLKGWVDAGAPESEPFANAFAVARKKALAAATAYVAALRE
jgi:hypothetical protein